jgi:FMN-dependent NADH-azoreductase
MINMSNSKNKRKKKSKQKIYCEKNKNKKLHISHSYIKQIRKFYKIIFSTWKWHFLFSFFTSFFARTTIWVKSFYYDLFFFKKV